MPKNQSMVSKQAETLKKIETHLARIAEKLKAGPTQRERDAQDHAYYKKKAKRQKAADLLVAK